MADNDKTGAARQRTPDDRIDGITVLAGNATFSGNAVGVNLTVGTNGGSIADNQEMTNVAAGGAEGESLPTTSTSNVTNYTDTSVTASVPAVGSGKKYTIAVTYDLVTTDKGGKNSTSSKTLKGTIQSTPGTTPPNNTAGVTLQ